MRAGSVDRRGSGIGAVTGLRTAVAGLIIALNGFLVVRTVAG